MREFREIRLDLGADGTGDAAAPYISLARTQLGVLKNQMRLGGLLQGSLAKILPDGTRVVVSSLYGRDSVRIIAAGSVGSVSTVAPAQSSVEFPEVSIPSVAVSTPAIYVGEGSWKDSNYPAVGDAYRWNGGGTPTNLGEMDSGWNNYAIGISPDGSVIAVSSRGQDGTFAGAFTGGALTQIPNLHGVSVVYPLGVSTGGQINLVTADQHIGYWTRAGGLVDLNTVLTANAMSRDGNFFVGYDGTTSLATYYEISSAVLVTPAGVPANSEFTAASKDGSLLAGDYLDGSGNTTPFIWTKAGGAVTIADGALQLSPFGVTDDAATIVLTRNAQRAAAGFSTNGTTGDNAIYLWSAAGGLRYVAPGIALCISADGRRIGGTQTADPSSSFGMGLPAVWMPSGGVQVLPVSAPAVVGWVWDMALPIQS